MLSIPPFNDSDSAVFIKAVLASLESLRFCSNSPTKLRKACAVSLFPASPNTSFLIRSRIFLSDSNRPEA